MQHQNNTKYIQLNLKFQQMCHTERSEREENFDKIDLLYV